MRKQVNRKVVFWIVALLFSGIAISENPAANAGQDTPDAKTILAKVRINQSHQQRVLNGHLRKQGDVIPFQLALNDRTIRYTFSEPPLTLILRLGDSGTQLLKLANGKEQRVTPAEYATKIKGTDITFEDLSLDFLYWPHVSLKGTDHMLTRRCWKLRLQPPTRKSSQYSNVIIWVEQESGALLRADCYDWQGKLLRRFTVVKVQKDKTGNWILKQMRVQEMKNGEPDGAPTYLEIAPQ